MNNLDKQYQALLRDILDNGVEKGDRTGTGTLSVFGRTIRHNMREGFPLLTTKKMYHKGIFIELLWLLGGDTNIQWLCQNNCNIWVGDAYKNFLNHVNDKWHDGKLDEMVDKGYIIETFVAQEESGLDFDSVSYVPLDKKGFIERIKTDDDFADEWGWLGPIYGKQWRDWDGIDQITKLINSLKKNPDSRRLMVNAWNVGDLPEMVLPPCHYGFQVYTRELSIEERLDLASKKYDNFDPFDFGLPAKCDHEEIDKLYPVPRRAISLIWTQRSVDTFLGLPFNIASYGALLCFLGEMTNMMPDELIGQLGDTHLYKNHIEQAKKQVGYELDIFERYNLMFEGGHMTDQMTANFDAAIEALERAEPKVAANLTTIDRWHDIFDEYDIPRHTREPHKLPKLNINTEFWNPKNVLGTDYDAIIDGIEIEDFQVEGYESYETIKAPLSN